jgi:hypothetical protein
MLAGEGNTRGYLLVATLGAVGGGLAVLVATRAVPRVMGAAMAGMMHEMMSGMGEEGCSAEEM